MFMGAAPPASTEGVSVKLGRGSVSGTSGDWTNAVTTSSRAGSLAAWTTGYAAFRWSGESSSSVPWP